MSGLYDIDKTVVKTNTYIGPGIHENLELIDVVYKPTETSEFLAFYFTDENGDRLSHTEWPKKMNKPLDQMNDDEKQVILGLIDRQRKLVHQIVSAIVGPVSLTGNTFTEFAQSALKALEGKYKGVKVRAKVVYDYRGFTSLANNPDYRFIEPMSVSKENSEIKALEGDKFTRTNQRNSNRKADATNIVDDVSDTNGKTEDKLPF